MFGQVFPQLHSSVADIDIVQYDAFHQASRPCSEVK